MEFCRNCKVVIKFCKRFVNYFVKTEINVCKYYFLRDLSLMFIVNPVEKIQCGTKN